MTSDAEREAEIRLRAKYRSPTAMVGQIVLADDVDLLLRLLDEARAEIARLREHRGKPSTTKDAPNALPCPFCGSQDVHNWKSDEHHIGTWLMICYSCECEGPETQSEEASVAAWNARLQAPPRTSAMERAIKAIARAISPQRWANLNAGEESREIAEAQKLLARAIEQAEAAGFRSAIDKTTPGWQEMQTAIRMIRDAVEEVAPAGGVPSRDVGPPEPIRDAEDIIAGVIAIREQTEAETVRVAERQIEALDAAWGKVCETRETEARAKAIADAAQWHDAEAEKASARARQHGANQSYRASSLAFMKRDAHEDSAKHFRALAKPQK